MDQLVLVVDGWPCSPHLGLWSALQHGSRLLLPGPEWQRSKWKPQPVTSPESAATESSCFPEGVSSEAGRPEGRHGLNCDP